MSSRKPLTTLTLLLLAWFTTTDLSGCAVVVKDQIWCANKPDGSAVCAHTLAKDQGLTHYSKEEWDQVRVGWVSLQAQDIADTKGVIEKLCHQTKSCRYDSTPELIDLLSGAARDSTTYIPGVTEQLGDVPR